MNERTLHHAITIFEIFFIQHILSSDMLAASAYDFELHLK